MADYRQNSMYNTQTGARTDAHLIDEGLRSYMLRVYNYMALGIAFTAVVTLVMLNSPALMQTIAMGPAKWVLFIAILGLGFFAPRLILTGNTMMAHAAFWTYAALWGTLISPMILAFIQGGKPELIFQALAITSATFAATSLFGYTTKKDLSAYGTFFMMATIGLIIAIVVNIFLQSTLFSLITSFAVVLLFSAITAYETQEIKQSYYAGDDQNTATGKAIFGAFILYGSFITLFIHILNILGIMGGDD
ncbi:MAG: Bax inhibitor-1/YccA family protein [Pseudomonadota bacterium]